MSKLVSKQCVDFVKGFEGFYPEPYLDIVGVKTLGYGMTGSEIEGLDSVTEEQASNMLEDLLNNKYAAPLKVDLDSKGIELNQNEFDALVSMSYNVGVGGVLSSTLYKNICNGISDVDTITSNFEAWSMAGGEQVYGLLRRRREEAQMFFGSGNAVDTGYTSDFIKSVQHDLQRVSCLEGGEANADGIIGPKTKEAIRNFRAIVGLTDSCELDSSVVSALNSITQKPTLGGVWPPNSIATRFIQWYIGLDKTGVFDANMTQKVKEWQVKAGIWSAAGADGVIREQDWNKILK